MHFSAMPTGRLVKICPSIDELASDVRRNIPCEVEGCEKVLPQMSAYRMHLTKFHKISNESVIRPSSQELAKTIQAGDAVQYHCPAPKCVYHLNSVRFFSNYQRLRQHYLTMHAEKKFECERCKKKFGMEKTLKDHLKGCGLVHMCKTCGSPYSSRQAVLTHCSRNGHKPPDGPTEIPGGQMTLEEHREIVRKMSLERLGDDCSEESGNPELSISQNNALGKNSESQQNSSNTSMTAVSQNSESQRNGSNTSSTAVSQNVPVSINRNRTSLSGNVASDCSVNIPSGAVNIPSGAVNIPPGAGSVGKLLLPKSLAMLLPVEFKTVGVKAYAVPAQPASLICIPDTSQSENPVLKRKGLRPLACKPSLSSSVGTSTASQVCFPEFVDSSTLTDSAIEQLNVAVSSYSSKAVAETQTTGDYILKKAMQSADIPIQRESRASQVSPKAKIKRSYESLQTIETQTANLSPAIKKRKEQQPMHSVALVNENIKHTQQADTQCNFDTMSSVDEFDLLDISHNETQTVDLWESLEKNLAETISTQTLESFLQNPQANLIPELSASNKTTEQCIQTHDSFMQFLEEASVGDPLLSSTACEKIEKIKAGKKVSTQTGLLVPNMADVPPESAVSKVVILQPDSSESLTTVDFGVGTEVAGDTRRSNESPFEISLWNNELLLGNKSSTGVGTMEKGASCSSQTEPMDLMSNSNSVSLQVVSDMSCQTSTSTGTATLDINTIDKNIANTMDNLFNKHVDTGTGTQTIGELIDSTISITNNFALSKASTSSSCETQTVEKFTSNDAEIQTIDSILDSSANSMQTQTMDDMFDQFLSNMETQTTTDDLLESLGLNTMETQTMTDLNDSSTVETQTTFHGQNTLPPLAVQTDMETQTLFPGCEMSQMNQMDMETQTVWDDLESLMFT